MLLDTARLDCRYAPIELGDKVLVVTASNKKRGLNGSAYNDRRRECEEALSALQENNPQWESLCQIQPEEFERVKEHIPVLSAEKRAEHAVGEERRTLDAFDALQKNDLATFLWLMTASHESLRDLFEVSCAEMDCLIRPSIALGVWVRE